MSKILIKGFYGQNNLGDDYILYAIFNELNQIGHHKIEVLVAGEADCREIVHPFENLEVSFIPQKKWRKFYKIYHLVKNKYWIIGGGGLWPSEDVGRLKILQKDIGLSRKFKTQICFYGIDINSISVPESKEIWQRMCNDASFTVCRNNRTTEMLKKLGCKNIYRSSDITFGLETLDEKLQSENCLHELGIRKGEYVIWAVLMPWPTWEYDEEKHGQRYNLLVNQLREIANMPQFENLSHVFMPFHYEMELPIIKDIVRGINGKAIICDNKKQISIGEKRLLFKYAKQCVSMKFHGAMFAIYNGIPAAIVSYSDKTSDVLDEVGLSDYYTEYGIRDTQDFCKSFDLDINQLKRVVENSCQEKARDDFTKAGKKLKEMSKDAKERLACWIK